MPASSLERSGFAQTALVSLAMLVAIALLVFVLAYWTWVWFSPSPEPASPLMEQASARVEAASGLFGGIERGRTGMAPTGIAIKLLGVVSANAGRPAYAVLRLEPNQVLAVRAGTDVVAGVRLAEVHPDGVILLRNGTRETLAWPERIQPANSAAAEFNK